MWTFVLQYGHVGSCNNLNSDSLLFLSKGAVHEWCDRLRHSQNTNKTRQAHHSKWGGVCACVYGLRLFKGTRKKRNRVRHTQTSTVTLGTCALRVNKSQHTTSHDDTLYQLDQTSSSRIHLTSGWEGLEPRIHFHKSYIKNGVVSSCTVSRQPDTN